VLLLPPATSTSPFERSVAVWLMRATFMLPVLLNPPDPAKAGVAEVASKPMAAMDKITSVLLQIVSFCGSWKSPFLLHEEARGHRLKRSCGLPRIGSVSSKQWHLFSTETIAIPTLDK
jgi:hypothetical protein